MHNPSSLILCNERHKRAEEIAPALSAFADCSKSLFPTLFAWEGEYLAYSNIDFAGKVMWLIYKLCSKFPSKVDTAMDDKSAA
jgi:hypothetical protein